MSESFSSLNTSSPKKLHEIESDLEELKSPMKMIGKNKIDY